jgi:hypothetical protein
VRIRVPFPGDEARFDVCLNHGCASIEVTRDGWMWDPGNTITVYASLEGGAAFATIPYGRFQDGDQYSLIIRDLDGVELAAYQWTATYARFYPNGEECDEEPCMTVSLDESNAL